ncbi:hypothetical protein IscW_ISCW007075 [Ixodes scapularis]|uniref:Uncharacterized protein n=1 Tax=Ixodes scapularis TaxID=6945 RepID=B7PSM8_IXOSC|nr:hypothetical protein IscW_ISCW007075 [Ixodes scapularis]|eukprot:XP_002402762.1 hypothetical protein IscW_ISCW007075 [Ixodes scapularis]
MQCLLTAKRILIAKIELVSTMKSLTSHVLVFKLVPRGGPFGHAREEERLSLNRLLVRKVLPSALPS